MPDDRLLMGGNKPPSPLELGKEAVMAASVYINEHPTLTDRESAKSAKLQFDRLHAAIGELEKQESETCEPLRIRWSEAKGQFAPTLVKLSALKKEIHARIQAFLRAEKAQLAAEAEERRRIAEEARAAAEAAKAALAEAREDAKLGVLSDVASALDAQREAQEAAKRAGRQTKIAERDAASVRLGGGFSGRAIGVQKKRRLEVRDWRAAIEKIGLTDALNEAILTASRLYRRAHEELPPGVVEVEEEDGGQ
jgi:hypothetical protein